MAGGLVGSVGPYVRPARAASGDGFIPVDQHGLVVGAPAVFAAGDGTTIPLEQGGIAAQQAFSAATAIAARAGAPVTPHVFRPVLRAALLSGAGPLYLRQHVAGGAGDQSSIASDHPLWWPPTKVAASHLAPYLASIDDRDRGTWPSQPLLSRVGDPVRGTEIL